MTLEKIRKEIDAIDDELIALLEQRFNLVSQLLPHKQILTDSPREQEILSKTDSPYIQELYQEIFRLSKQLLTKKGFHSQQ